MRLDQAIAARFADVSRRKARELIASGHVLVNERVVAVASREVKDSDRIVLADALPEIAVIRETPEWVAVDKPPGLPTQPARDRAMLSLEEILRVKYRDIWLVHRLDTPASGVVLFARTRDAAARFSRLFAGREMRKCYLAKVAGTIASEVTIETPIGGNDALSIVRPRNGVVEVEIRTGRTHQIRIHLASIGHPIIGDRRYGGPPSPRLMLHAWRLEHPSIGVIEAPPPFGAAAASE